MFPSNFIYYCILFLKAHSLKLGVGMLSTTFSGSRVIPSDIAFKSKRTLLCLRKNIPFTYWEKMFSRHSLRLVLFQL